MEIRVMTNTSAEIHGRSQGHSALGVTTFGWRMGRNPPRWKRVYRSKGRGRGKRVKTVRHF